jgi:hypothetical protein
MMALQRGAVHVADDEEHEALARSRALKWSASCWRVKRWTFSMVPEGCQA